MYTLFGILQHINDQILLNCSKQDIMQMFSFETNLSEVWQYHNVVEHSLTMQKYNCSFYFLGKTANEFNQIYFTHVGNCFIFRI